MSECDPQYFSETAGNVPDRKLRQNLRSDAAPPQYVNRPVPHRPVPVIANLGRFAGQLAVLGISEHHALGRFEHSRRIMAESRGKPRELLFRNLASDAI